MSRTIVYPQLQGDSLHTPALLHPKDYSRTPAGVQRNVQLASVLEPLVYTPGKTTRETDCSLDQRLAFFLAAGVNIGEPFRLLAERLLEAKKRGTKNSHCCMTAAILPKQRANASAQAAAQTRSSSACSYL